MQQTKFVHHRNALLESNYRFLAYHNKELQERLDEYETVQKITHEGRLQDLTGTIRVKK